MLFNSLSFFGFLAVVFAAYWTVKGVRAQNWLLLVASYCFYAFWDWRFLGLLIGISAVGHLSGRMRSKTGVWLACVVGLGALGLFKYFNFFSASFAALSSALGIQWSSVLLNLGLPMGVSFYSFKMVSYAVDCYKGKIESAADWRDTFLYIGFFPQLAAGPIDRATNLLPQFATERSFDFDRATRGIAQIAYGLFKKAVVADTLCMYVDKAWGNPELYGAIACLTAAVFYSIQIYCDFSGYSDIACGTCRLLGFEPMLNFDRPYLSKNFSEFWRRWHISLSFWFRDYVYIPLGGSRVPFWKIVRNIWIVFLLSGLWHGAAWTFVIWGGLHALFLTGNLIRKKFYPSFDAARLHLDLIAVNLGVTFAWIFFRAHSFADLKTFWGVLFGSYWQCSMMRLCSGLGPMFFLCCLVGVFLLGLSYLMPRDCAFKTTRGKFVFTFLCLVTVVLLGVPSAGEFIYAQF